MYSLLRFHSAFFPDIFIVIFCYYLFLYDCFVTCKCNVLPAFSQRFPEFSIFVLIDFLVLNSIFGATFTQLKRNIAILTVLRNKNGLFPWQNSSIYQRLWVWKIQKPSTDNLYEASKFSATFISANYTGGFDTNCSRTFCSRGCLMRTPSKFDY